MRGFWRRLCSLPLYRASSKFGELLADHPKLKNDLRRPTMEETGSRATIFELEGLGAERRKYIKWLLMQSVAAKTKIESTITDEALVSLSEKLATPLQFEFYLTRALEEADKVGQNGGSGYDR